MVTRKLQKSKSGQFFITLPNQVLDSLNWKKGDLINISLNKDKFILKKSLENYVGNTQR